MPKLKMIEEMTASAARLRPYVNTAAVGFGVIVGAAIIVATIGSLPPAWLIGGGLATATTFYLSKPKGKNSKPESA